MINKLNQILQTLIEGNLNKALTIENISIVSKEAMRLLNEKSSLNSIDVDIMNIIISISQIVYNNSNREILFLDDGVYDQLLELDKQYNENYQVGSPIVQFDQDGEIIDSTNRQMVNPIHFLDKEFIENSLYYEDVCKPQANFDYNWYTRVTDRNSGIIQSKKNINVPHKYPKLVGSLDKCKFVLNKQAEDAGVIDNPNVKIFERDFLGKQLQDGLFGVHDQLYLIAELKYDGISVEADVCDHIISARSRGDANNDIAADLTPILGGMKFPFCPPMDESESFGMKFEAIMTYLNLDRYSRLRGRSYKNSRNTMTGLLGSIDGYDFRDLITLVPLETSLDIDPLKEIAFMNQYYQNGELLRYSVITGGYYQVLFKVYKFVEEVEKMRDIFPFMYDGVVIHHTDPRIKQILGRKNSINQYSIAIKFNPLKAKAIFTGYSYTVGQNGVITPMIHYTPVEFYGTIHDHSSGHSYARFQDLNLAIGDVLNVEYMNDVMPYVSKAETDMINPNPPIQFTEVCPSCGVKLVLTSTGKTAMCCNPNCSEKILSKMVNMLKKLGLKDFAEASVRLLGISSFRDFMEIDPNKLEILGPTNAKNFLDNILYIRNTPIYDYQIVGAIGFDNIAIETWKKVLAEVSLDDIIDGIEQIMYNRLVEINGIGPNTAMSILTQREYLYDDLDYIRNMSNVIRTNGQNIIRKKIRFTGVRDKEMIDKLNQLGYDAGEGSVTRDTFLLVIPYEGFNSKKVDNAIKYGIEVCVIDQLYERLGIK